MYWFPFLNDTDVNVLYEVDGSWLPLYAGIHPEWQRANTDTATWAIKKYTYSGTTPTGRERVGNGKKDMNYIRDDRASYFA